MNLTILCRPLVLDSLILGAMDRFQSILKKKKKLVKFNTEPYLAKLQMLVKLVSGK